jgi:hypothetical protein
MNEVIKDKDGVRMLVLTTDLVPGRLTITSYDETGHSAGSHYPHVVFAQESPRGLRWGVICPDGAEFRNIGCARGAFELAERLARTRNT